jgi:predicted phosphoadenosine phosphosulfate sulfurtransferase
VEVIRERIWGKCRWKVQQDTEVSQLFFGSGAALDRVLKRVGQCLKIRNTTFMHTHLAYRAKYGCDMSDMITDVEMQLGPVLDQHFWVTLPVHSSVWDHIFDDDYHVCLPACRIGLPPDAEEFSDCWEKNTIKMKYILII